MTTRYVLTVVAAFGAGVAAVTAWQHLAGGPSGGGPASPAAAPRVEASDAAALRGMMRQELAQVRADIGELKATQVTQAGVSTSSASAPLRDEPVVDPEIEERRHAADVATSELLRTRIAAKRWRREDEAQWRQLSVDLPPDRYAELRAKLNSAMNSGEVDSSDFDHVD